MTLSIQGNDFVRNGRPVRLLSGALHYFRVVPEYWRDRLIKLREMGLNTVETYVPWNLHEPQPGEYCFTGDVDIERYLSIAHEVGLMAIVRPGPYICSEWDLGGLPAWLLRDPAMRLRCCYRPYLDAVDRYYDELLRRLVPFQASRGGPVVAMQVENEYGSYGNDRAYLRHLAEGMQRRGVDALLFTSDGPTEWMLEGGTLPGVLKTANFGSRTDEAFAKLREHQPDGPLMCGEFWNGWFDHWGEEHHSRSADDAAQELERMLSLGGSVNFYMFHGGTNFGYMAGANHTGSRYQPDVGSYDYDAPLDEAGAPTAKFHAFREVIARYVHMPELRLPPPIPRRSYGTVRLESSARVFDQLDRLSTPIREPAPVPMEQLGQNYGFVLYRTTVRGPREALPLVLQDVHDRALVFVDGEYRGVIDRDGTEPAVELAFGPGSFRLDILVEAMGRVNYGPRLHDRKGITHGVRLGNQFLYDWTIYPLPLDDPDDPAYGPWAPAHNDPALHRGSFTVDDPADTFLALPGWTKGVVWVNGFNLGRYWDVGPQRTLYVPAPKLRRGENRIVVFELHECGTDVELRDSPDLG